MNPDWVVWAMFWFGVVWGAVGSTGLYWAHYGRSGGMTSKSKQMCRGCRQDYYNHNADGGCWMYDSATIKKRAIVGTFENPPYDRKRLKNHLSCYCPDGMSIINADDCRLKGAAE